MGRHLALGPLQKLRKNFFCKQRGKFFPECPDSKLVVYKIDDNSLRAYLRQSLAWDLDESGPSNTTITTNSSAGIPDCFLSSSMINSDKLLDSSVNFPREMRTANLNQMVSSIIDENPEYRSALMQQQAQHNATVIDAAQYMHNMKSAPRTTKTFGLLSESGHPRNFSDSSMPGVAPPKVIQVLLRKPDRTGANGAVINMSLQQFRHLLGLQRSSGSGNSLDNNPRSFRNEGRRVGQTANNNGISNNYNNTPSCSSSNSSSSSTTPSSQTVAAVLRFSNATAFKNQDNRKVQQQQQNQWTHEQQQTVYSQQFPQQHQPNAVSQPSMLYRPQSNSNHSQPQQFFRDRQQSTNTNRVASPSPMNFNQFGQPQYDCSTMTGRIPTIYNNSSDVAVSPVATCHEIRRTGAANTLHIAIEKCYEQLNYIRDSYAETESKIGVQIAYKSPSIVDITNITMPSLSNNPSRVDRLVAEYIYEHSRVVRLHERVKQLLGMQDIESTEPAIEEWLNAINVVQERRKQEIDNAAEKCRTGEPRVPDERDVLALAEALRVLRITTRKIRTALWYWLYWATNNSTTKVTLVARQQEASQTESAFNHHLPNCPLHSSNIYDQHHSPKTQLMARQDDQINSPHTFYDLSPQSCVVPQQNGFYSQLIKNHQTQSLLHDVNEFNKNFMIGNNNGSMNGYYGDNNDEYDDDDDDNNNDTNLKVEDDNVIFNSFLPDDQSIVPSTSRITPNDTEGETNVFNPEEKKTILKRIKGAQVANENNKENECNE
ncbi:unnamed protein product [Didymodactylos carnosus]|uniref:Uncharacterized protein n=1 Tax=Didymodactylos carnosus TaxID=1234261 RepID=A0A813SCE4_9BILA|nr:unnamed protein product [Didymodactylos carnosus]CAF0793144.1 unnamed protein product [Didymodactylos carnosus]CAF3501463.1 unnamed protein product [Didymodactylos carnosus]CAF3577529.1 unnamed protein product [Didymodactylos carnosus]